MQFVLRAPRFVPTRISRGLLSFCASSIVSASSADGNADKAATTSAHFEAAAFSTDEDGSAWTGRGRPFRLLDA